MEPEGEWVNGHGVTPVNPLNRRSCLEAEAGSPGPLAGLGILVMSVRKTATMGGRQQKSFAQNPALN